MILVFFNQQKKTWIENVKRILFFFSYMHIVFGVVIGLIPFAIDPYQGIDPFFCSQIVFATNS